MIKALKKLQTIYWCIRMINWKKFWSLYDRDATVILWYYPFARKKLFVQSIERDFGFVAGFLNQNVRFRIYFGRNVGKFHHKTIFFSSTKFYDPYGFSNYARILHHLALQLESQNNLVYPHSDETLFWENKEHMHAQFTKLALPQPKTFILQSLDDVAGITLHFPCLLKEIHSSSSMGLYKVNSTEELIATIKKNRLFDRNESLLAQELLAMRRDLRVTFVGEEICHHYWRINLADEWKPTATGYGSRVDFVSFPENWRAEITRFARTLPITSAAFDLTWVNDDLSGPPIILEVSPFYQPNPPVDIERLPYSYGEYKKKLLWKDSWDKKFVEIVFELQIKIVALILQRAANRTKP
jgi:hypothetical protein